MAEYAERGIERMAEALQLAMDYFSLSRDVFCKRWLPGREDELERQTTPQSWENIVETLAKPNQRASSPTTGKTPTRWCWPGRAPARRGCWCIALPTSSASAVRTAGHHGAGLQPPAALEIRHRLRELIGNDARASPCSPATRWPCAWSAPVLPSGRRKR
jgi:ATP-dependent DNA helicase RecQ